MPLARLAISWRGLGRAILVAALLFALPSTREAAAEMRLPPGFSAKVYVTGHGFDSSEGRGASGIPSISTLAFDPAGVLYLGRSGRRYGGGEVEDVWPLFRVPLGGAQITRDGEARFLYGPPLRNPQVGAVRGAGELFLTTFDRERKVGVLYRVVDGRAGLFAGGTPDRGEPAVLKQPEGVTLDPAGNFFIADRDRGVIVKLDATGKVVDPRYASMKRPRVVTMDGAGNLWVGADGGAEAPWQPGEGEMWLVTPDGAARLVLKGPIAQAISWHPAGFMAVADRHTPEVFAVTPDGARRTLIRFTDTDAPRSLIVAPTTEATRKAGIAGDLLVVLIPGGAWPVNQVIRISGPFDSFLRDSSTR